MNFVKNLNMFGVEAKEIPCLTGIGAPTNATEGAVGSFYMDTTNGDVYKCTTVVGLVRTWVLFGAAGNNPSYSDAITYRLAKDGNTITLIGSDGSTSSVTVTDSAVQYVKQTLTSEQMAQARANIGAATVDDVIAALQTWEGGSY